MCERISIADKKPEEKSQNLAPQIRRKTESSQTMNSPVDRILFLQRTIGNQAVGRLIESGTLQAKLRIGQPGDVYEQEADRVAEQVMRMTDVSSIKDTRIQRKCPKCLKRPTRSMEKDKKEEKMQAKENIGQTPEVTPQIENNINALKGGGQPLPESTRALFEPRFGYDLSKVRVHEDSQAAESARTVNASAYTVGQDIMFGTGEFALGTRQGQKLMAHELTHVVQQSGANATRSDHDSKLWKSVGSTAGHGEIVQRSIEPEDVAVEMVGREFELSGPFTSGAIALANGTRVTVVTWANVDPTVVVQAPVTIGSVTTVMPVVVQKTLLRPVRPGGTQLDPYSAGVDAQARAVERNEAALVGKTGAERRRLEGLLAKRREVLNRKLIQETMFNRFDPIIAREVAAANTAHGLTGAAALDPNLVKSMVFQESEMGTSGTHLEVPPSHPVKSRFNLGQVIDSSGMALLTMLEREQPVLMTTFFLTNLRSDLAAAQIEKTRLERGRTLNAIQTARLAELRRLSSGSWETFIWGYKATGRPIGFVDAITWFFASSSPAKNMDYEFWIHMMVLWLFEKKTPTRSWLDTIKAYNGSGRRAEHYREAVARRAADAEAAAGAGTPFMPTR